MRRCAGAPGRSVPMAIGWVTLRENRTGATGMGSIVRAPAAPLSQLVDTIWDWDMPRQAHRFDRMLPSAGGQLVINLVEDESRVYDAALRCRRFAGAAFDGPANRSFVIDTAEQVAVIGIVFRAGAAAPFFRERMDLLANDHVDLDALAGGTARGLRERLLEAGGPKARPRIVEAWLPEDRKRGEEGKRVSVRLDLGCSRILKKKNK